mgnify:CR=1 FL=1
MANLNNFDANQVDPSAQFDPLPAGKYIAVITESEFRPTRAANGRYLQLAFQVVDGPFRGRFVWARLNLENESEMAVKLARGELSSICRAVGIMQPRDSIELHGIPIEITVGLKRRDDTGEFTNIVKGYARRGGGAPASHSASAKANGGAVAVGAAPGSTPPWKR